MAGYVPTTPTITLCEQLVTELQTAWVPTGNDEVLYDYIYRFNATNLKGRKVVLFPTGYDSSAENRGEDSYSHLITALIVERYEDADSPPKEWVTERIDFVFDKVVSGLDYFKSNLSLSGREISTARADVTLYDPVKLATDHLFYSTVEFEFTETLES